MTHAATALLIVTAIAALLSLADSALRWIDAMRSATGRPDTPA